MTQRADGSFPLSKELEAWLGPRFASVKAAAAVAGDAIVATAVAIALIARDEADRADEWRPAVAKAKRWLQGQKVVVDVEALLGK